MRAIVDLTFQYGSNSDKIALNELGNHAELVTGAHCVYVYSLADSEIQYPKETGSIIYIGEACRANEPTGKRFAGHISKSPTKGNNFTTNHTVTYYYYAKQKLRLHIYRLDDCKTDAERKSTEKRLIVGHVKRFGAQPLGQGTTGSNYTPKAISNLCLSAEEEAAIALTLRSSGMLDLGVEIGENNC